MGKMILIAVAAGTFVGGLLLMSMNRSISEAEKQHSASQEKTVARDIAKSGMAKARRYVWSQWKTRTYSFTDSLTGTYQGGTYITAITSNDSGQTVQAQVTVTGEYEAVPPRAETHVLEATFHSDLQGVVPSFMRYAIMADSTLAFNGNARIEAETASDGSLPNADVHTNAGLEVSGRSNDIFGFGTYADSRRIRPSGQEDQIFKPHNNENGQDVVRQASEVEVPEFNPTDYRSKRDHLSQDVTWEDETIDFGSRGGSNSGTQENPYIWYVEGDLSITGSVTTQGYGILVVEGDISAEGNASTQHNGDGWLGLYADGNVTLSGNSQLHGQIYADGDLTTQRGTPHIRGNLAANGKVTLNGTPDITYTKAIPSLTKQIWDVTDPVGMTATAYTEW